jgi:hypothetical protein
MRHRGKEWRPQVETLKTDSAPHSIDSHVKRLTRGERLQVVPLLLDGPGSIDGGMDTFRSDRLKHGGDSGGVLRRGSPDFQRGFHWERSLGHCSSIAEPAFLDTSLLVAQHRAINDASRE